jgi:hypothetical protein
VYACVCFLLYGHYGAEEGSADFPFRTLAWSSVSLFELSTTVRNECMINKGSQRQTTTTTTIKKKSSSSNNNSSNCGEAS